MRYLWGFVLAACTIITITAFADAKDFANSLAGEFVTVPGGCFRANKKQVCLDNFSISKYVVTQQQWKAVMGYNPSSSTYKKCGPDCPVTGVSWNDVQNFISRLNSLTGKYFRLPSEAEWEYACRSGGKDEEYCGGNNINELGWYYSNSNKTPHPVGQKQPNSLGIYDMSGNVWQWVNDWFYYKDYPSSRCNPTGPSSGTTRVVRGGTWQHGVGAARAGHRYYYSPDDRDGDVGFRLVTPAKELQAPLACNELYAEDRLKSCEPNIALTAAKEIINNPEMLKEPLQLFPPVAILFQNGMKDEAVFWFYAAKLRVQYQLAFENRDLGQLLTVMQMTVGPPINNYAFQDISNFNRILDRVLKWDTETPNPFREKSRSEKAEKQIEQIYTGLRDFKAKLSAEKNELEAKARKAAPEIEQAYAHKDNPLCRKGQLDPAYAAQETNKEWILATDFVKNNKDAIRVVGAIKDVYPESSKLKPQEIMAWRYILSVNTYYYAVVDVTRSAGDIQFSLACVTKLPIGKRDPFKDECEQQVDVEGRDGGVSFPVK